MNENYNRNWSYKHLIEWEWFSLLNSIENEQFTFMITVTFKCLLVEPFIYTMMCYNKPIDSLFLLNFFCSMISVGRTFARGEPVGRRRRSQIDSFILWLILYHSFAEDVRVRMTPLWRKVFRVIYWLSELFSSPFLSKGSSLEGTFFQLNNRFVMDINDILQWRYCLYINDYFTNISINFEERY